jgi:ABC-type glycerol-3-phosphate transport system substrate-binding protein
MRRLAVVLSASVLVLAACGGGAARSRAPTAAGPVPDVVRQLQVPDTPDRIIYTPPVSLAKPPDTTAHGRKPRS